MNFSVKKITYDFFEYILAMVVILECRSVWTSLLTTRNYFSNLLFVISIICILGCILFADKISLNKIKNAFFINLILSFFFFILLLATNYNIKGFIKFWITVCAFVFYMIICNNFESIPSIFLKYRNLVVIVCFISVVFWFLSSVLKIIVPTRYVYTNWTPTGKDNLVKSYYDIYFNTQSEMSILNFTILERNTAIFNEAPMASLHFSLSLAIQMYLSKSKNNFINLILIIGVLTTVSTTGYVVIIFCYGFKYLMNRSNNEYKKYFKIILLPTCLFLFVIIIGIIVSDKMNSLSGSIRLNDYYVGFKAWIDNFLFGAGFENLEHIKSFMPLWRGTNSGFSNSLTQVLSDFGLVGGIIYYDSYFIGLKNALYYKQYNYFGYIIICIFLFNTALVSYNYITIICLLFFYIYHTRLLKNMKIN